MEQAPKTGAAIRGVKLWTSPSGERRVLPDELTGVKLTVAGFPNKLHAKYADFMAWANAPYTGPAVDGASAATGDESDKGTAAADGPGNAAAADSGAATPAADAPAAGQGSDGISPAQAYALRIWSGQSPDLPRAERVARVKAGLDGQGMNMDGVVLPRTHDSKPEPV